MRNFALANLSLLFFLLNIDYLLLPSLASSHCPSPTSSPPPPPPSKLLLPPPPPPPKLLPPPPPKLLPPPPPPPSKLLPPSPPPPSKLLPPPPPPPPASPKEKPCPPPPPPPAPKKSSCPINTLKLDACIDILGGLVHIGIGPTTKETCCPVLKGITGLDAALCFCTTIRAKLLNIEVIWPVVIELLIDGCGKHVPSDYHCPA